MNILSLTHPQQRLSAHGGAVDARRQQLEAAAEQFEAMFLQQILKQMRKAGDVLSADNPMRSRDLDTLRDFYDETLADSLAIRRQTGISDLLVQQLAGDQDASDQAQRLAAMDQQPLPRSTASASSFQPLADTWRRGVGQLERVWERGSVAFQRLVDSVVKHESGGRVDAVSPVGALGLMQLMPDTAREMAGELGVPYNQARLLQDGDYNKRLGSAYLNKMLERYSGSEVLALAAYPDCLHRSARDPVGADRDRSEYCQRAYSGFQPADFGNELAVRPGRTDRRWRGAGHQYPAHDQ